MIVSGGVREMPAAASRSSDVEPWISLPRETLSVRPRVISGSANPACGTG